MRKIIKHNLSTREEQSVKLSEESTILGVACQGYGISLWAYEDDMKKKGTVFVKVIQSGTEAFLDGWTFVGTCLAYNGLVEYHVFVQNDNLVQISLAR